MGADEVLLYRFFGLGAFQRGFGKHPGLQWQKIAEDTRKRHHDINARATECFQRDQISTRKAAVAVETGRCTHQRKRLGDRPAVGFDIVRAP